MHPMTTISTEYGFNAPAEVVFGVLTDPDRTARWLPSLVHADAADYTVDVVTDKLQVRWQPSGFPGLQGTAEVRDAPAGGSVLRAEVEVPVGAGDQEQAENLLAEAMKLLQRDVSDNFNAG